MLDRQYGKIVWICDGCADDIETGERDFSEALIELHAQGWRAKQTGGVWHHWCGNCQQRTERGG